MQKSIPPSSGGDYHHQRHRSERPSPDRSPREVEPPHPAKRKYEHHSDRERDDRDCDYEHERHHHHRSESSSRMSSGPVTRTLTNATTATISLDRKQKANVFSRIIFPAEEEASKKRKVGTSSTTDGSLDLFLFKLVFNFVGWGTDENTVITILGHRNVHQRQQIRRA
ncbi:Annexin repeat [Sesbania bispinosa]|nr:Annexin repeat [Sesbania bispinosa]